MKPQQIQRYEAEEFGTASLRRLEEVAQALQLSVSLKLQVKPGDDTSAPERKGSQIDVTKLPLKEMVKRGWLDQISQGNERKSSLSTASLAHKFLANSFRQMPSFALFRRNIRADSVTDVHALIAWQARILQKARALLVRRDLPQSNLSTDWISSLTHLSQHESGVSDAVEFLWNKGIIVVAEPHLKKTFVDGAAMLLDRKVPVIALSARQDRLDNFWFVLLHELGHIFRHRGVALETGFFDEESTALSDDREIEADEFAKRALVPEEIWSTSFVRYTNSPREICEFAAKHRIGPWIVAGRIRRERNDYALFSELVGRGVVRSQLEAAGLLEVT